MKSGDKVKFNRHDTWGCSWGIDREIFESEYSYDKVYTVETGGGYVGGHFTIETTNESHSFVYAPECVYLVKPDTLPDELFTI